jgi:hypothetical protein
MYLTLNWRRNIITIGSERMSDIIVTDKMRVKELIKNLQEEFEPDDIIVTGLWIRKLDLNQNLKGSEENE